MLLVSAISGIPICLGSYGLIGIPPHTSTGETPSLLLFWVDCRTPTEAAYIPPLDIHSSVRVDHYREQLMLTLSSARKLAKRNIQKAQQRYKDQYDSSVRPVDFKLGDWVFLRFPQDGSGLLRKLSRPWHGPYCIVGKRHPDATVTKVYHPQHGQIQVHQSRLCRCPDNSWVILVW